MFLDCDDWFYTNNCLEEIAKVINKKNNPDLIRLPYRAKDNGEGNVMLHENSLKELAHTVFVAPWTKCVKRKLFVPFPENTLIEDVSQHIEQIDKIETLEYCPIPVVVWNRENPDAISANGRIYKIEDKRYSSIYRVVADLMDLKLTHDYCIDRKNKRIEWYLNKIRNAKENEIVRLA